MRKNTGLRFGVKYVIIGVFAWLWYAIFYHTPFYFLVWKFPVEQYPLFFVSLLPSSLLYGYPYSKSLFFVQQKIRKLNAKLSYVLCSIFGGFWWGGALSVFYFLVWGFPYEKYSYWLFTLVGSVIIASFFYNPNLAWFSKWLSKRI